MTGLVLLLSAGCGRNPADRARARVVEAGYAFTVDEFLRAAADGRENVVRDFLAAGMQADVVNAGGVSAVERAAAGGHGHVVALLVAGGARPAERPGMVPATTLVAAAQSGDHEAVSVLLQAGADPAAEDADGLDALSAASLAGHATIVRMLAPLHAVALDHALQLAAVRGHTAVLAALLDAGASPLATSVDGRTALMFAAQHGHEEAVALLRQRGAVATALDHEARTAADHAEAAGHEALAASLRAEPAEPSVSEASEAPLLSETAWPGAPADALAAAASQLEMTGWRARQWPLVVDAVSPDSSAADIRLLTGDTPLVTVGPGDTVGGTGLVVERITHRLRAAKQGRGRLVDMSEVVLREGEDGARVLAVLGRGVFAGEGCAEVKVAGDERTWQLRRGDEVAAGGAVLRVIEVRPRQLVLENAAGTETATVTMKP